MIVFPAVPVRNPSVNVVFHAQVFSAEECQQLIATADAARWEPGSVGGRGGAGDFNVVRDVRSNYQQRLPVDANGYPLNRLSAEVCRVNSEGWRFDLSGFVADDLPWLMRYDAEESGHYDWHIDIGRGANASRKLGFSLQLSPPESYDGGDLEFANMAVDRDALRRQGTLIIFPAYLQHRVAPTTRGTRFVCVGWMHGPSFR